MKEIISNLSTFIWQYPVIILCLTCGIFFTLRLSFVQLKSFPHAISLILGKYDNENEEGHITHFQALTAALSGTIGLGNIAGVAIAISIGGPGAIFWMWVIAFLGMATKYAECTLGTLYREKDPSTGEFRGGPMHYITKGLGKKWKPLASFFALCVVIGSLGAGSMFQSNQAASALKEYFNISMPLTGLCLSFLLGIIILGGIKRIGSFTSKVVPLMCGIYIIGALLICILNIDKIPHVFSIIIRDAFSGNAAMGGVLGAVIITGIRRAIFSNEAGLGSAPIAHAAVKTNYPVREGIVASLGPFIDTIIVCTATAMVIIMSGSFGTERFQQSSSIIDFENRQTENRVESKWHFSNELIPKNNHSFHHFRSGNTVLSYTSRKVNNINFSPAIDITNLLQEASYEGIRFSLFINGGNHIVRLVDDNGKILISASLNNQTNDNQTNETISKKVDILGFHKENEWHSRILHINPNLKELLKSKKAVSIQFSSIGQTSFYIDKISTVRSLDGINLTSKSFNSFFPGFGTFFISIAAFLFALSTLITWSYYGETAAKFLFGQSSLIPYKSLFIGTTFLGTILHLDLVIDFSDLMIGFMVIPNGIALLALSNKIKSETTQYFYALNNGHFKKNIKQLNSESLSFKILKKIKNKK